MYGAMPPGVVPRHRSSPFSPVQVPDLIGIRDRRYLDHTGLLRHDSPVDLMRYAALNQGADSLSSYDGFIPADFPNFKQLPDPGDPIAVGGRYSDDQLYALGALSLLAEAARKPQSGRRGGGSRTEGIRKRGLCELPHTAFLHE